MRRTVVREMMDDPDLPPEKLEFALRSIRTLNRYLGGTSALLRHLEAWSRRWPRAGEASPISVLDVGTGSADIPLAVAAWADRVGVDVRVTAIDINERVLEVARRQIAAAGREDRISLRRVDAYRLMDHYEPGSFDYVHAGLMLHHFQHLEVLTLLRIMDRLASRGMVWNDLVRSPLNLAVARVLVAGRDELIRHDAIASVRAGFVRSEVLDFARRLDLTYCRYRSCFAGRFTLAGEKPSARPAGTI
ncbi:MAG: methyltransferase domain-containing protein [Phycisphaeraceae bacterium]|nr:methyltransferase domain-containing protein [Phycisphaeraceae bacterium]